MVRNTVHHLSFGFPLDIHFYGQGLVVSNLLQHTRHNSIVVSEQNDSLDNLVQSQVAEKLYGVRLHTQQYESAILQTPRINHYSGIIDSLRAKQERIEIDKSRTTNQRKLDQMDRSTHNLGTRIDKFQRKINEIKTFIQDPEGYFTLVRSYLQKNDEAPILTYHNFNGLFGHMEPLIKEGANIVYYLHCLAGLYLNDADPFAPPTKSIQGLRKEAADPRIHYVAVSDAVKQSFERYAKFNGNIYVISNGVDPNLYSVKDTYAKQRFKDTIGIKGNLLIGYSGRFDELKGVSILKELLQIVEDQPSLDYGFLFACSNGQKREEFMKWATLNVPRLVEEDRLKMYIDIAKYASSEKSTDQTIRNYFEKGLKGQKGYDPKICLGVRCEPLQPHLDVYVHPSRTEALSLSILEALMSGVPVVASKVGGIPQVVNFNNGVLIDIENKNPTVIGKLFLDGIQGITQDYRSPISIGYSHTIRGNFIRAGYTTYDMTRKLDDLFDTI